MLRAVDDATALALKRAGDWGQVEHCVRHGKVFVTADKMAALYAYYRRAKFVLVQTQDNREAVGFLPTFIRYTFTIRTGL